MKKVPLNHPWKFRSCHYSLRTCSRRVIHEYGIIAFCCPKVSLCKHQIAVIAVKVLQRVIDGRIKQLKYLPVVKKVFYMTKKSQWLSGLPLVVNCNGNDETNTTKVSSAFYNSLISHFFFKSITASHINPCSILVVAHLLFSIPNYTFLINRFNFLFYRESFLAMKMMYISSLFWTKVEKITESGLISFHLVKIYVPWYIVKKQIRTIYVLYTSSVLWNVPTRVCRASWAKVHHTYFSGVLRKNYCWDPGSDIVRCWYIW